VQAHPRTAHSKEDIIQAFYDGIKHRPETTFGNVKADVLADKEARKGLSFQDLTNGTGLSLAFVTAALLGQHALPSEADPKDCSASGYSFAAISSPRKRTPQK
jgi:hypothetical protein